MRYSMYSDTSFLGLLEISHLPAEDQLHALFREVMMTWGFSPKELFITSSPRVLKSPALPSTIYFFKHEIAHN